MKTSIIFSLLNDDCLYLPQVASVVRRRYGSRVFGITYSSVTAKALRVGAEFQQVFCFPEFMRSKMDQYQDICDLDGFRITPPEKEEIPGMLQIAQRLQSLVAA